MSAEELFKFIKELFPSCKAKTLYEACKNCNEIGLLYLVNKIIKEAHKGWWN